MKIVILGGSGFIGSRIAQYTVAKGHNVTVISRSPSLGAAQGDVYDPSTYSEHLKDADAVVHSIGTFFPSQTYKKLVSEPLSLGTLPKLVKARLEGPNPMSGGFAKINTQSAATAAQALAEVTTKRPAFVYISAAASCLASAEYIESKRRAEQLVASHKQLRPVLMRPGIVYDPAQSKSFSARDLVGAGLQLASQFGQGPPRTSVNTLAAAVLEACEYPEIEGVVSHEALDAFNLI